MIEILLQTGLTILIHYPPGKLGVDKTHTPSL